MTAGPTAPAVIRPSNPIYLAPIFLLALALRCGVACTLLGRDPRQSFFNQASELGYLAQSVVSGHGLGSPFGGDTGPSAFLAPGYPLLVALAFRIFGAYSSAAAAMLVACQVLFGALTAPTLMILANRLFGARTARIAGTLCAISPTLIWLPLVFWESTLSSLLLTSALLLASYCATSVHHWHWIALGLLCGVTMLFNPALMLVLIAAVSWTAWRTRKSSPLLPALGIAVWLLVFAAWPIRNEMVFRAFIPLRTNLGYELWQGNHQGSNGDFDTTLHPNVNAQEHARYAALGEIEYMQEKSARAEVSIESDPGRFSYLCLLRLTRFWTGMTPGNHSRLLIANIWLTSILAASGLFLLHRKNHANSLLLAAPFLLYPLPYYLTHADFRFRLVIEPIALMLSVYAIRQLVSPTTNQPLLVSAECAGLQLRPDHDIQQVADLY